MRHTPYRTQGFTLIEILIAVTISMLVISIASTFYQRTIRENAKIKDSAMLQESAFFTSHLVNQHLRQAGFKGIDSTRITGRIIPIPSNKDIFPKVDGVWEAGQFLKSNATSISIRFNGSSDSTGVADASIIDCSGAAVAAGTINSVTLALTNSRLVCTSDSATEIIAGSNTSFDVSDMIISLGVDDGNDGSIDRYVDSGDALPADLAATREILMNLLLVSQRNIDALGRQYQFNNTVIDYPDNRYRREVVVRTALRNL